MTNPSGPDTLMISWHLVRVLIMNYESQVCFQHCVPPQPTQILVIAVIFPPFDMSKGTKFVPIDMSKGTKFGANFYFKDHIICPDYTPHSFARPLSSAHGFGTGSVPLFPLGTIPRAVCPDPTTLPQLAPSKAGGLT